MKNFTMLFVAIFSAASFGFAPPSLKGRPLDHQRKAAPAVKPMESRPEAPAEGEIVKLSTGIENAKSVVCGDLETTIVINFGAPEIKEEHDGDFGIKINARGLVHTKPGKITVMSKSLKEKLETTIPQDQVRLRSEKDGNLTYIGGGFEFVHGMALSTKDHKSGVLHVLHLPDEKEFRDLSCDFYQSEIDASNLNLEKPMEAEVKPEVPAVEAPNAEAMPVVEAPMAEVAPEVVPAPADKAVEEQIQGETASVEPTAEQVEAFKTLVHQTTEQGSAWLSSMSEWVTGRRLKK